MLINSDLQAADDRLFQLQAAVFGSQDAARA
jgi:hypothetical protein